MRRLAVLIGTRAARLSACGIAALVSKQGLMDGDDVGAEGKTIGIATDGSLYNVRLSLSLSLPRPPPSLSLSELPLTSATCHRAQKYPGFPQRLEEGVVDIFGEKGRCVALSFPRSAPPCFGHSKVTRADA